jgi:hypothetical protein
MTNTNYPKAWSRFIIRSRALKGAVLLEDDLQIKQFIEDFRSSSQWSARFRLAKSFQSLNVGDAYKGTDTPDMYSAIIRIFLVYSSFESYCEILGIRCGDESKVAFLQNNSSQENILCEIRKLDPTYQLFKFLASHLNPKGKSMMGEFISGENVNVSFLAKAIRHIFSHGILAANSGGLPPKKIYEISQKISEFLLDCMDDHFDRLVSSTNKAI